MRAASRPRRAPSGSTRSPSRPGKIPNAMPVLRTWRDREERQHLVASPSAMRCSISVLGDLIGDDRGGRDGQQARPLQRARPVCGSGSALGADQPRSSSRLHSMHFVAYGRASRRSSRSLAAALAQAVAAGVDPGQGGVDAGQQVLGVVLERQLDLAVERLAGAVGQVRLSVPSASVDVLAASAAVVLGSRRRSSSTRSRSSVKPARAASMSTLTATAPRRRSSIPRPFGRRRSGAGEASRRGRRRPAAASATSVVGGGRSRPRRPSARQVAPRDRARSAGSSPSSDRSRMPELGLLGAQRARSRAAPARARRRPRGRSRGRGPRPRGRSARPRGRPARASRRPPAAAVTSASRIACSVSRSSPSDVSSSCTRSSRSARSRHTSRRPTVAWIMISVDFGDGGSRSAPRSGRWCLSSAGERDMPSRFADRAPQSLLLEGRSRIAITRSARPADSTIRATIGERSNPPIGGSMRAEQAQIRLDRVVQERPHPADPDVVGQLQPRHEDVQQDQERVHVDTAQTDEADRAVVITSSASA